MGSDQLNFSSHFAQTTMRIRFLALGVLFILALSTARSAPEVAPDPTLAG